MVSVLQASAWYPPSDLGGTEIYLSGLVRELQSIGVKSTVVAPLGTRFPDGYHFEGVRVRTYSVNTAPTVAELRGDQPHQGFSRFRNILADVRPDVYHQHSLTRGLGLPHLRVARELGLRTVVTVHLPGATCVRGTMMRYGKEACDGRIAPFVCAACWSNARGMPKPAALALAAVSSTVASFDASALPASRVITALSASAMVKRRRADIAAIAHYADRIVAVSQWLYDALAINGVPSEKLVLNRQGVDCDLVAAISATSTERRMNQIANPSGLFRLLCLGRWQSLKGIDVIVRAVRALPTNAPLELVIHCAGDGHEERAYQASVRGIAGNDPRIRIAAPVSRALLADTLLQASAIAVPSRCLETGPLVVLEAKAAGLPILGSRLGGIAELVSEPDDGLLVPPNDIAAWTDAILRIMEAPPRTWPPRARVRTMRDVAADMSLLYSDVCAGPIAGRVFSCVSH